MCVCVCVVRKTVFHSNLTAHENSLGISFNHFVNEFIFFSKTYF